MQTNNKLREALEFADRELRMATEDDRYGDDVVYLVGCMRTVAAKCRAALSVPPRNCDMFSTVDEVHKAWDDYLEKHPELPPSCKTYGAIIPWLFAPTTARKGETDESK